MSSLVLTCRDKASLQKRYIPALRLAGWDGPLRLLGPGDCAPSLEDCPGVLLTGGGDIDPRYWDPAEPRHPSAEVDEIRDALEVPLIREAWRLGLPILGICRGEQILNVALGGSLIQDIPSHFHCEPGCHACPDTEEPVVHHAVALVPDSRLAGMLGTPEIRVNSYHHQAVGRLAPGLRVAGRSGTREGLVEAIEAVDGDRWTFGVQWHPEGLVGLGDDAGLAARRLFEEFVQAARKQKIIG